MSAKRVRQVWAAASLKGLTDEFTAHSEGWLRAFEGWLRALEWNR